MIELKKFERQNIKRRLKCDPIEYIQAFEHQGGRCELCCEISKHFLKPDIYKRTKQMRLLCDHCLHWSKLRVQNPKLITERMMDYFELGPTAIM